MEILIRKIAGFLDNYVYRNQIPVLVYHRVNDLPAKKDPSLSVNFFSAQMKNLVERGYYFASLTELSKWLNYSITLPQKTVVLTFDDGFRDVYKNVFPILKKYRIKAGIFLIYNYIGKSKYFSYNRSVPQKILPENFDARYDIKNEYLSKSEILEVYNSGYCEFGSHTLNHPSLKFMDVKQAYKEIAESKTNLEDFLNLPIATFCYPYGHFNDSLRNIVSEVGYQFAVTTVRGKVKQGDNPFTLKRWYDMNLFVNMPPVLRKLDRILVKKNN